jgi:hypothetical protein
VANNAGREGDLEHGPVVRADLAVPPGAEPDGEPFGDRLAQRPRGRRLRLAIEIDVGMEAGDLGDGSHQAAVLSRNAASRAIHGAKLGRVRMVST